VILSNVKFTRRNLKLNRKKIKVELLNLDIKELENENELLKSVSESKSISSISSRE